MICSEPGKPFVQPHPTSSSSSSSSISLTTHVWHLGGSTVLIKRLIPARMQTELALWTRTPTHLALVPACHRLVSTGQAQSHSQAQASITDFFLATWCATTVVVLHDAVWAPVYGVWKSIPRTAATATWPVRRILYDHQAILLYDMGMNANSSANSSANASSPLAHQLAWDRGSNSLLALTITPATPTTSPIHTVQRLGDDLLYLPSQNVRTLVNEYLGWVPRFEERERPTGLHSCPAGLVISTQCSPAEAKADTGSIHIRSGNPWRSHWQLLTLDAPVVAARWFWLDGAYDSSHASEVSRWGIASASGDRVLATAWNASESKWTHRTFVWTGLVRSLCTYGSMAAILTVAGGLSVLRWHPERDASRHEVQQCVKKWGRHTSARAEQQRRVPAMWVRVMEAPAPSQQRIEWMLDEQKEPRIVGTHANHSLTFWSRTGAANVDAPCVSSLHKVVRYGAGQSAFVIALDGSLWSL
jgi:hypothetical protein